jgi:hypothetical protein
VEPAILGTTSARRARVAARLRRALFATLILTTSLLGLRELALPQEARPAPGAPAPADHAAEDFAQRFARAYLTYDAADPEAHAGAMATFTGDSLDADAGFTPPETESQAVLWTAVAQQQRTLSGDRVLTVAVQTSRGPDPVYLAVPVRRVRGKALALAGYPAFVGAPLTTTAAEQPDRGPVEDRGLEEVVTRALRNYLAIQPADLRADLTPGAVVTLPSAPMDLSTTREIVWANRPGGDAVLVTVDVEGDRGATFTLTYELGVVRRDRWYVRYVEVFPQDP